MIIGRVVHSEAEGGRHIIRIAFGWDAEHSEPRRPFRKDPKCTSIFRRFARKLNPRAFTAWRRV